MEQRKLQVKKKKIFKCFFKEIGVDYMIVGGVATGLFILGSVVFCCCIGVSSVLSLSTKRNFIENFSKCTTYNWVLVFGYVMIISFSMLAIFELLMGLLLIVVNWTDLQAGLFTVISVMVLLAVSTAFAVLFGAAVVGWGLYCKE
jgi:hypothetical protein